MTRSIGITGGIGSGKSMVCKILKKLGYPVFYADAEAKKAMNNDALLKSEIIELLGIEAYENNELNRPFVAAQIFGSHEIRKAMDNLVHPAVYRAFETWKSNQTAAFTFNESALLFETGSFNRFDATVLVTAPQEIRIKRVMARDEVTREQVISRINHQLSDEEKSKMASIVLVNDDAKLLTTQILAMLEQFSKDIFFRET